MQFRLAILAVALFAPGLAFAQSGPEGTPAQSPPLKPPVRPNASTAALPANAPLDAFTGPWLWRYRLGGNSLRPLAVAAARDRAMLWLAVEGRDEAGVIAPALLRFGDEAGSRPQDGQRHLRAGAELRGEYSLTKMAGGPAGGIQTVVAMVPLNGGRVLLFVTGPATRLLSARFDPATGRLEGLAPVSPGGEPLSGVSVAVAPDGMIAITGLGEARRLIAWYSPEGKLATQSWVDLQGCGRGGDGGVLASAAAAGGILNLLVRVENCNASGGMSGSGLRLLRIQSGGELRGGAVYPNARDGQLVMVGRGPLAVLRQPENWRVLDASGGALVSVDRPLESQYLQGEARIAAAVRRAHGGAWLAANLESGAWLGQLDEAGLLTTESLTPQPTGPGEPLLAEGGNRLYLLAPTREQRPDGSEQPAFDLFAYLDN